jgi:hypothetical protein
MRTVFARIRGFFMDRCADPNFGPAEVAAETGILLRSAASRLSTIHREPGSDQSPQAEIRRIGIQIR